MSGRSAKDLAAAIAPHLAAMFAELLGPPAVDDPLLPIADAAREAATSVRVVRDAIRAKELPAYGRERDRAVRRSELLKWVESRRVIHKAIDDADIERRVRRISAQRKAG